MGVVWFCSWGCGPGFWVWVEDVHEKVAVFEADHDGVGVIEIWVERRRRLGSSMDMVLCG